MKIVHLELAEANAFVLALHRHHKPVVGHRFSLGLLDNDRLCGVAIVGRPVARMTDPRTVAEVTRLCTDGTKNACSHLYAAAARAARALGFSKIQTFILATEPGTSVAAAGWDFETISDGGDWNRPSRGARRTDQPMTPKVRWGKVL